MPSGQLALLATADEPSDTDRAAAYATFRARLRAVQRPGDVQAAMGRLRAAEARQEPSANLPAPPAGDDPGHDGGSPWKPKSSVAAQDPETGADLREDHARTCTEPRAEAPDLGVQYEQANNKLQQRMRMLDDLRPVSALTSVRACGERPIAGEVSLTMKGDGNGGFAGIFRCASVWSCPECSPVVRADRARIMEAYALAWMEETWTDDDGQEHDGHGMAMATLTSRHGPMARLESRLKFDRHGDLALDDNGAPVTVPGQIERTAGAWRRMLQSRWWRTFRARYGIRGVTRAIEVTHSWANGWHTHIHAVLWTQEEVTDDDARAMEDDLYQRWEAECRNAKLGRPTRKNGVDVQPARRGRKGAADLAKYVVKVQDKDDKKAPAKALGNELLRGDNKAGRRTGRTPFEVLRRGLAETADAREQLRRARHRQDEAETARLLQEVNANAEMRLWHEYERATKGHRMLTWTGEIRALLDELVDVEERAAADVVEEEGGATKAVLVDVDPHRFAQRVARVPGRRGQLRVAVKVAHDTAVDVGADPVIEARAVVRAVLESWGFRWGVDLMGPGAQRTADPLTGAPVRTEWTDHTGRTYATPPATRAEVVPPPRHEARHLPWQTTHDLVAGEALTGIRPRDWVRPEQARRRAAGLPVDREVHTPGQQPDARQHTGPACVACGGSLDARLADRHGDGLHLLCG
jgi:hypothetical protein